MLNLNSFRAFQSGTKKKIDFANLGKVRFQSKNRQRQISKFKIPPL